MAWRPTAALRTAQGPRSGSSASLAALSCSDPLRSKRTGFGPVPENRPSFPLAERPLVLRQHLRPAALGGVGVIDRAAAHHPAVVCGIDVGLSAHLGRGEGLPKDVLRG